MTGVVIVGVVVIDVPDVPVCVMVLVIIGSTELKVPPVTPTLNTKSNVIVVPLSKGVVGVKLTCHVDDFVKVFKLLLPELTGNPIKIFKLRLYVW